VALYLTAHAAFQSRIARVLEWPKLATALALLAVFALTSELAGWAVAAITAALLAGLCAFEARAAADAPAPSGEAAAART
jgi:membrane-bound ClpP family serine protease